MCVSVRACVRVSLCVYMYLYVCVYVRMYTCVVTDGIVCDFAVICAARGIWSGSAHLQLSCHYLWSLIVSAKSIGQTLEYGEKRTNSTRGGQEVTRIEQECNSKFIKA